MYIARQAGLLSFLHLDLSFIFSSSSMASKEERGERVPMSQYLDRRSRRPVPTLRSDRQPLGSSGPKSLCPFSPLEDRSRYLLVKGLAHAGCFVSVSNVLDEFEAATLFSF